MAEKDVRSNSVNESLDDSHLAGYGFISGLILGDRQFYVDTR